MSDQWKKEQIQKDVLRNKITALFGLIAFICVGLAIIFFQKLTMQGTIFLSIVTFLSLIIVILFGSEP